ncbi:hypothetical protein IFO70_04135 [Phormidium tenue FACHB-886]|nr:hypothetical protein [Phormidium tenue FACHB-886]
MERRNGNPWAGTRYDVDQAVSSLTGRCVSSWRSLPAAPVPLHQLRSKSYAEPRQNLDLPNQVARWR